MNATTTVKLGDLTAELTCNLCRGYLVDATTIIECLHSFCKSCIVVHLESSEYCPVCDVQLQPSRPLESVRSDKVLQEMVYKLVPGLYTREMGRRKQYYGAHPEKVPAKVEEVKQNCYITSNDDMQLSYEPVVGNDPNEEAGPTFRRYIKCKAGASISVVKKLISQKFELNLHPKAVLDIIYGDRLIPDDFLLMDVAYKYSWNQKNESHLPLKYKVHGDPEFFEAKTAPLISSDGAMESLKVLKLQAKLKVNGVVKKKPDGFGCVRSKKILQESVRSQLVLNESQQLVKPGKLSIEARISKKGRPPKNKPSGIPKPQVSQKSNSHTQPKEVQLSISEKGVMSATVPVTTAYNPTNSNACDGPYSFPRGEPMSASPIHGFPRANPQASASSRSVWTPKQQSQVVMTQLPQETTVRTTTWHPKIPKGILISQHEHELATKALKKKTSTNMTNMEALKGVNRKLKDKLPDHYYKADILPLSSPPAASSNGVRPRSGTNGKASPSKKQVFSLGEVRFTPVIAKKLLSSPGSKLQLDDSPKRHKIFKSRQQESSISIKPAANPTVPPVTRSLEEIEELPVLDISPPSPQHPSVASQESSVLTSLVAVPESQAPVSISVSSVSGNGIPAFLANHFNTQLFNLRNLVGLPNFSMYSQTSPARSPDFLHSLSKMAQEQHHQPAFLSQMLAQSSINGLPVYTTSSLQTTVASNSAGMTHSTCNTQLPVQQSPSKRPIPMVVNNCHRTSDASPFSDKSLAESERRVSDDLARLTAMVTTVSESEVPTKRRKSSSPSKLRRLLTAPRTSPKQKMNESHEIPHRTATVNESTAHEDTTTVNGSFYVRSLSSKSLDVEVSTTSDEVLKELQPVSESRQTMIGSEEHILEEEDQTNSADTNNTEIKQADHVTPVAEEIADEMEHSTIETGETEKVVSENENISETDEVNTDEQMDTVVLENVPDEQEEPGPGQVPPSLIVAEDECDDDDDNVLHIVEEKAELDQNEESSNAVDDSMQEYSQTPPPTKHIETEAALHIAGRGEKKTNEMENGQEVLSLTEAGVEDGLIQPNINNNEIVIEQSFIAKEPAISCPTETSISQTDEPDSITSAATSA